MTDEVNTTATNKAREVDPALHQDPKRKRYHVTFSAEEYRVLREFIAGNKSVTVRETRAILRRRMHNG